MDEYELILPFDTDSPEFARGVEIGMLLARLQAETRPVRALTHICNAEMVVRLAEATGTSVQSCELDADWMEVVFA